MAQLTSRIKVVSMDLELSTEHDLCCDLIFRNLMAEIRGGIYAAVMAAPPCSTFTGARRQSPGDGHNCPGPLRTAYGSGRYGLSTLLPPDRERVRIGTLLAVRTAMILKECRRLRIPFVYETPREISDDAPNMLYLDEFEELMKDEQIVMITVDQCRFGAATTKPTALLLFGIDAEEAFPSEERRCNNPRQQ